jgi:hypothetical protein
MQKLTRISSGQNNKSCSIIHHESNKIGFPFCRFFCDFLRNLQETGNQFNYWSSPFAKRPWKDFCVCNVVPRGAAGAAPVEFRRARRRTWPGKDGGGSRGALGFDLRGWTGVE